MRHFYLSIFPFANSNDFGNETRAPGCLGYCRGLYCPVKCGLQTIIRIPFKPTSMTESKMSFFWLFWTAEWWERIATIIFYHVFLMLTCSTHKSYLDRDSFQLHQSYNLLKHGEIMCNLHKVSICHVSCLFSWHQNTRFHSKLPGKPESFDDFTTTCFAKEEPPEAERDEEAQEEHNEAPWPPWNSPGVVVKTDSSDGFPLQGVGDTSAAFGMCINNYWKIVIVSCKKTWPWMIYVTSSESEGISMPYCVYDSPMSFLYILLVWHIVKLLHCPFYCRDIWLTSPRSAGRFFQLPFGFKKTVESHPMWPFFFGWSMGLAGNLVANRMDLMGFLNFFDPISFDSVKGFFENPTVKSALETSEWRADGSVAGISIQLVGIACNLKSILFCDGWLARPPAKSCSKSSTMIFFFPKSWPFF